MGMIFRYKDMRAESFQDVWPSVNTATAIRSAHDLLKSGKMPAHYAPDFSLYKVADEDPITGRVEALHDPKHIIDLVEIEVNDGE